MLHQIQIQRALPFEIVSYGHFPTGKTGALIERIENGTEPLAGPFSSKEELWRSLEI
jgi:hypothetical protein